MRVTAGKFRGKPLKENKFEHIRPTADMVKQAIFNKLQFSLQESTVLDLCCGTGALGIEALSRGAKEVVFVDKDIRSISLTQENLKSLRADCLVIKGDVLEVLQRFANKKFDIILFDPPYKSGLYLPVVNKIAELKLLSEEGVLVVEHAKEDNYIWNEKLQLLDEKTYGIKKVSYLKNK